MEFTAKMIAQFLQGEVEGDENAVVSNVSKIETGQPGTLTFLSNDKYTQYIYTTKASIVLVNKDFVATQPVSATLIRVNNAYECLAKLMQMYQQALPQPKGIEQPSYVSEGVTLPDDIYLGAFAYIGKGVKIGKGAKIYPQVYIGDGVTIGDNVTLYSGVKIYYGCKIGNNVILHAGTVIGSDGFGFAPQADGSYDKIPQLGNVVIEDNVEMGANCTIDRSTMGSTIIHKGVKLDNMNHVAHNCEIGENTVIAAQGGLAGSTILGKNIMVGGQSGFAGHMTIPDGCVFGAKTGVANKLKGKGSYIGYPAVPQMQFFKGNVFLRNIDKFEREYEALKKEVSELKKQLGK